jgi:hypothetical protein
MVSGGGGRGGGWGREGEGGERAVLDRDLFAQIGLNPETDTLPNSPKP